MVKVNTKWLASLSDGTTAIEGMEPFAEIAGELSPWLRLQDHLKACALHITGMRIQVTRPGEATKNYNLPSLKTSPNGRHERWPALRPIVPQSYDYFRTVSGIQGGKITEQAIEIRAIYGDVVVSLFVDETEGNESWIVIHNL